MKFKSILITLLAILTTFSAASGRELYSLNNGWRIFSATEESGDDAHSISLPYSWSQALSTPVSLTTTNYLRNIFAPDEWRTKRVFIKFNGVQSVADLFINEKYVAEHRGGATAFTMEITPYLKFEQDNIIKVRVCSAPQNDILPTSIEHEIYGGIYRDVELIVTPKTAISPTFYGSDGVFVTTKHANEEEVSGHVEVRFTSNENCERRVELSFVDEQGVEQFNHVINKHKIDNNTPLQIPFNIKGAKLWSPEEPNLYRATVSISQVTKDKDVDISADLEADQVSVESGFRVISVAESGKEKGAVRINGKPVLMRGVTLYHDHPSNGGVISKSAYDEDLTIVNEIGANAIRSAITPHDKYLYSQCDKQGLLVWIDMPLSRAPFFSDVAYTPTQRLEENGLEQMREIVYQNYNHPSVVMWGVFSMLNKRGDDATQYINKLNATAKHIDPMRPTVALSNQNGDMNNVPDLIVWRQNLGWDSGLFSDIKLWRDNLHSEWSNFRSGVMYGEGGSRDHQINRADIAECRTSSRKDWFPEGRQSAMHEEYTKNLSSDSLFWGVWLPTLFDFKSSRNDIGEKTDGVVEFNRINRKDAFYLYRALWNDKTPTLHIADKRAREEGDSKQSLIVYASDTIAPMAYIAGDSIEMTKVAPAQYRVDDIKVTDRTKVIVTQGDLTDSVELTFGSPLKSYVH